MKRKFDNVSLCSSLYTLTLLYGKVINILDVFSNTLFTAKDHSLNHAYGFTPLGCNSFTPLDFKVMLSAHWLPVPCSIIKQIDMEKILEAIQNVAYIGVLKQRWEEIKKLKKEPILLFQQNN